MLKLSASCLLAELLVLLVRNLAILVQLYHVQTCKQACGIPKCLEGIRYVCSCHCLWHHVFPSFVQVSCAPLSETESTRSNSFFSFSIFLLFVVPASMAAGVLPGTQTVILYAPHNADAPGMLYSCSSCSVSGVTAMIARMTSVRYLPPPCEVIHLCTSSGNLICRVRPS